MLRPHRTNRVILLTSIMTGDSVDDSYAKNSDVPSFHFQAYAKSHLAEAIDQCSLFDQPATRPIRIADFGCSSGGNTIDYAKLVVAGMKQKRGVVARDIQYFFSDQHTTDFNCLFQLMKPLSMDTSYPELQFYAAGVPGSFYTRLFPDASLDFAISIHAVHWLSRVPPTVVEKASAWNGGHVWIHGERPKVAEAYARQFQSDIKIFLNYRAAELAKGATLFLISSSRTDEHPTGDYYEKFDGLWCGCFESAWDEMVSEGVIDAEERDMFNVPQYNFHRAELELALRDVPELELVKLELTKDVPSIEEKQLRKLLSDPQAFADVWAGFFMAVMKQMVQNHIGEKRGAEFSNRLHRIIMAKASSVKHLNMDSLVTILRRK